MRPRGPGNEDGCSLAEFVTDPTSILVPRALLTRGQRSATRGSGHSRTQSPSYARSTDGDEGLWPNPNRIP